MVDSLNRESSLGDPTAANSAITVTIYPCAEKSKVPTGITGDLPLQPQHLGGVGEKEPHPLQGDGGIMYRDKRRLKTWQQAACRNDLTQ